MSARLYRLLLRAYPRSFRARFGDAMALAFLQDERLARTRGWMRWAAFWTTAVVQAVWFGLLERLSIRPRNEARLARRWGGRRLASFDVGELRVATMLQDFRFALRLFRKHPGPVGIAIGGLALAIGVVTAVFSLVNASMLRPYGMDDPATAVSVSRPGHGGLAEWSYGWFLQLREASALATVEAAMPSRVRFSTAPGADVAPIKHVLFVSGGYLPMLGGRTAHGRSLAPADEAPGAPAAVVVSDRFWKSDLSADPAIIGRTIWLNGSPVSIVGVMRSAFTGPLKVPPAIWATFAAADDVLGGPAFDRTTTTGVDVIARLAPGATMWAAQDQLSGVVRRFRQSEPASGGGELGPAVLLYRSASPMDGPDDAEARFVIASTFGALGLVLALACANTATLLLAAAVTRTREIGVRLALGATRRRLLRQMVSESLLLGGIAGGFGFLIARWVAPGLGTVIQMPPEIDLAPDGRVLVFTIVVALICGVGCGLSPARFGARGNVLVALQSQGGLRGAPVPSRFRTWFVGFQAAVSMLLLVVAAMLARTAVTTAQREMGLDADRLMGVHVSVPAEGFNERVYMHAALAAVRELPVVERASLTQHALFSGFREHRRVTHAGRSTLLFFTRADADYLRTAGLRVLRGRPFSDTDHAPENPVALISESAARALFGTADPIGQRIEHVSALLAASGAATLAYQTETPIVIGVVNDTILDRDRHESAGAIYRPISESRPSAPGLLVRTTNPAGAARAIEVALRRIDPRVQPTTWAVRERIDASLAARKMLAWLAAPVAALAFLLAGLGVYGVTSFVVGQRKEEVSIRLAIGASPADILRLVVTDGLRPVITGLAAGLAGTLLVTQVLARPLSIDPLDPLAIAMAAVILVGGGVAAVVLPARRAARTDPAGVLRGAS